MLLYVCWMQINKHASLSASVWHFLSSWFETGEETRKSLGEFVLWRWTRISSKTDLTSDSNLTKDKMLRMYVETLCYFPTGWNNAAIITARFVPVPPDKLSEILSLRDEVKETEEVQRNQSVWQRRRWKFKALISLSRFSFFECVNEHICPLVSKGLALSAAHTVWVLQDVFEDDNRAAACVCVCYLIITHLTVVCLRFLRSGKCEKKQIALSNTHESIQTPIKQSSRFLCCLLSFKDEPNTSSAWIRQRNV